jgi:hypothetical protein
MIHKTLCGHLSAEHYLFLELQSHGVKPSTVCGTIRPEVSTSHELHTSLLELSPANDRLVDFTEVDE